MSNDICAAIDNLRENQKQLDMDGCMVGVSRQALDQVLQYIADLVPRQAVTGDAWQELSIAPTEKLFLCRRKSSPHITFEASIVWDSDSGGKPYKVLVNETYEDDILDDAWEAYQWTALPVVHPRPAVSEEEK